MAEELGKIEKPQASQFANKKKLYLVPLLYLWQDAPSEYNILFDIYWQQVKEQLANLESRMGSINRIYHESIAVAGEEGLALLEKLSGASYKIVSEKTKGGAQMEAVEDAELVGESMDWERHLMMGFISEKAAKIVSDFFNETSTKRYAHIARMIGDTFKDNEAAMLFIREGHHIQFPSDIEVFSVFPPALNDVHRWLRDYNPEEKTQ